MIAHGVISCSRGVRANPHNGESRASLPPALSRSALPAYSDDRVNNRGQHFRGDERTVGFENVPAVLAAGERENLSGERILLGMAAGMEVLCRLGLVAQFMLSRKWIANWYFWIAADLIAQAEHDPDARAILLTPVKALASAVARAIARQLPASGPARQALATNGGIVLTRTMDEAIALSQHSLEHRIENSLSLAILRERKCLFI